MKSFANTSGTTRQFTFRAGLLATAVCMALPGAALAQTNDATNQGGADVSETAGEDEIIVIGEIARTIENSLETKRDLDVIGDAIVGDDIGDLPDHPPAGHHGHPARRSRGRQRLLPVDRRSEVLFKRRDGHPRRRG